MVQHTFASHWMMDGGCISKLCKTLGHSNVCITQKYCAHLAPNAFESDYGRVDILRSATAAPIYNLQRDDAGRIIGRVPGKATEFIDPTVRKVSGREI